MKKLGLAEQQKLRARLLGVVMASAKASKKGVA